MTLRSSPDPYAVSVKTPAKQLQARPHCHASTLDEHTTPAPPRPALLPQAPGAHPPQPSSARAPRHRWRGWTAPTHTLCAPPGKVAAGGGAGWKAPTHTLLLHRQGMCGGGGGRLDSAHIPPGTGGGGRLILVNIEVRGTWPSSYRTTKKPKAIERRLMLPFPHTAPLDSLFFTPHQEV